LEDLLVDRDGLEEEALLAVGGGHSCVGLDRLAASALARVEVPDLQPGADVARVRLDELAELRDRFVVIALRQMLLGSFEDLGAIEAHGAAGGRGRRSFRVTVSIRSGASQTAALAGRRERGDVGG